ncbi:protein kintoun [Episyrphus balteatus]|uniref:protein kintoun n=1 Tax=Episyrphus balteatus TaxID=286459 RepID=UPI002485823E|nr:protein kintoun [Episyrphus balteatus]
MSVNTNSDKFDITCEEFEKLSIALRKDEFRKLFLDYCEEIQNPENRKQYEAEIKQLEAERGVDVTFLNPQPGFVIETSVNGDSRCFLNIAKCDKISAPTSENNNRNTKKGVNWTIPHALLPPRDDFHDNNCRCQVFDVIFHPEALLQADNNVAFKQCLIETACNGIEKEFKVRLDRINITFSAVNYKGVPRPSIIRKASKNAPIHSEQEPSPLDAIFPSKPLPVFEPAKLTTKTVSHLDEYCKPKYVVKHRRPVDMSEMTYELDAKINATVPKELVVEIELPLLNSAANCMLDVTDKRLYFVSEKPAKYKLNMELPYGVNDKEGSAKFDSDKHRLVITLPVKAFNTGRGKQDFNREDSGVESDIRDDMLLNETVTSESPQEELKTKSNIDKESQLKHSMVVSKKSSNFLKDSIKYNFPQHFDLNILDETIAIVLHVRNVDNESIDLIKDDKSFHIQFTSIGTGFYPTHYAFYFEFVEQSDVQIDSIDAEAWDNNVVLNISLKNFQNIEYYHAGLDNNNAKIFKIQDEFILGNAKKPKLDKQSKLEVSVELLDNDKSIQIEIKPKNAKNFNFCKKQEYDELKANSSKCFGKKNRKPNKKLRSFSESTCDDIKKQNIKSAESASESKAKTTKANDLKQPKNIVVDNNEINVADSSMQTMQNGEESEIQIPISRKQRSYSESRNQSAPTFKSILKHSSRYLRTMSDSCSSIEEPISYSCSIDGDMKFSHSFHDIPEEDSSQHGLSESCKKTVRFSDVIKKNVFRLDSSILGRRKINQKKRNKKRALQRRHSEGDSADYEDNKYPNNNEHYLKLSEKQRKSSKHDSGLDLSTQSKNDNSCPMRNRVESESSDLDSKNSLMFDIDM